MTAKINREDFLNDLNMVKPGLDTKDTVAQSACFVFQGGYVMTFNDEVACRKKVKLDIEGAIKAKEMLDVLSKVKDEFLMVRENGDSELEFKGAGKGFGFVKEAKIELPIDKVEMPEKWRDLPKEFTEAVGYVHHCCSREDSQFAMTCIHITPDFIEACDNLQAMRYKFQTGFKKPVLVRGRYLSNITALGMDKMAMTENWIHFKNQAGLLFSCRRYVEDYENLDEVIECEGQAIAIPKGVSEVAEVASVMASDQSKDPLVNVSLKEGMIEIEGQGLSGWYREKRKVAFSGEPMNFVISPLLLKHISQRYSDAIIGTNKLKVTGPSWEYVTVLGAMDGNDEAEKE